jgi:ubiquinone/menaquinone biosynthesis C-methylase UbiE
VTGTSLQIPFPQAYEKFLVPGLFRPWVDDIFAAVELKDGDRVLDVACGTGVVARAARERLGKASRIIGIDVNPQMLAVAREAAPGIEWREGNAAALPVSGEERFDVVVCQQGLQFFPDRPGATREMRRVMAPGGRAAIATWRPLEEVPFFAELGRVAESRLGPIVDRRHALGDAAALASLLEGAGLRDVVVRTVPRQLVFDDPAMLLRLNAAALVGMSAAGAEAGEEERARLIDAVAADSAAVVRAFAHGAGVAFDLSTNLAVGRC